MARSELFFEWYDRLFASKAYADEIDCVLSIASGLGVETGRVLEVGVGTGNHTLELARRGCEVLGLDNFSFQRLGEFKGCCSVLHLVRHVEKGLVNTEGFHQIREGTKDSPDFTAHLGIFLKIRP